MKFLDYDSPLMQALNKVADLLILNMLALLCCLPVVTIGASMTALHYQMIKMVRGEECYVAKGFFKSFKENFKQATVIWLILLVAYAVLIGDYVIMIKANWNYSTIYKGTIIAMSIVVLFVNVFIFPILARFSNTTKQTFKNALAISVIQFPKTILMIVLQVAPLVLFIWYTNYLGGILFLFGISVPAYFSAKLYNKFFLKMEERIMEANGGAKEEDAEGEDEKIFHDQLDKALEDNREA